MRYLKPSLLLGLFFLACYIALPNFFHNLSGKKINLGLDLRGGASITLHVDFNSYIHEKLRSLLDEIKGGIKSDGIALKDILSVDGQSIKIFLDKQEDLKRLERAIKKNSDVIINLNHEQHSLKVQYSRGYLAKLQQVVIEDSISNIQRRIDNFGIKEAAVYSVGSDKIAVELPGIENPDELKDLIGKTAKLNFHLIANDDELDKLLLQDRNGRKFPIKRRSAIDGELLSETNARLGQNGKAAIWFKFNSLGAKKFENLTKKNVGRPFAIVLDDVILTAPVIKEPIYGGQGEISGSFTLSEAREIAILLKSGALPAKLNVIEQRLVGPTLGADSIRYAKRAGIIAFLLVSAFMIFAYRSYGVIASCVLLLNAVFIIAILTIIQATLTLPGIAGFILTIGMAVDNNVLIFERIREEFTKTDALRNSILKGFQYAKSTIIDANITTLIAAIIMLFLGSGAVKGFAITLSIGIFSSMFTAIVITYTLIEMFALRKVSK